MTRLAKRLGACNGQEMTRHLAPPSFDPPRIPAEDDLRRKVKKELRKRAIGLRKATPLDACAARSARIVETVSDLDAVRAAGSVALFWPIVANHEVDLRALDATLRGRGARVAYPAIVPAEGDRPRPGVMSFHFVDDTSALEERGFGFAEPAPDSERVSADLREIHVVIVPALSLDPRGQRIGYGAGYYDRALAGTQVVKVGVIFDFQLVPEVPATPGDVAVDWIVSDRRVLRAE
jgi:5-formyltetrahydrofolate cyclo-ligase